MWDYRKRVEGVLDRLLPVEEECPVSLHKAMRYGCMGGGKRLRAGFVYCSGHALGGDAELLDYPAAAVEMIHAFSLIHDDLPCIDNDDLRRGKPTCHKVFGEDIALLAGDALHALAFETLVCARNIDIESRLKMLETMVRAVGSRGIIGGEVMDVEAAGVNRRANGIDTKYFLETCNLKTAKLIQASMLLGAISAGCKDKEKIVFLDQLGYYTGMVFQVVDDILEVEGEEEEIGKSKTSDINNNTTTAISLYGLDGAKALKKEYTEKIFNLLGEAKLLESALGYIITNSLERRF